MPHAVVNGARLWYEVRGSGEPLLLHHGYTASRLNWLPVAERLADRFRIILMEGRGTGDSEHTEGGYHLGQYAADVASMLDHLDLARVTFAGHSMGGGIGYLLGLDYPERLNGLILMAPIPAEGLSGDDHAQREERRALRLAGDRAALLARYRATRFRDDVETDAWFESRVDQVLGVSDGHYDGSLESMRTFDVADRLGGLDVPTLMIAGGADSLLLANLGDFMALPNAALHVFSRAGHEVAIHEPDGVAGVIADFMTYGPVTAADLTQRLERLRESAPG